MLELSLAAGTTTMMFKVMHMAPARWKTITLPPIFGGRIPPKALLLAPLALVSGSSDAGVAFFFPYTERYSENGPIFHALPRGESGGLLCLVQLFFFL